MKQKIIIVSVVFLLGLVGAGVGGIVTGYVRGSISETRIEALTVRMTETSAFQKAMPDKYVPRIEYEKDYARLLKGLETVDSKLDRLLNIARNSK